MLNAELSALYLEQTKKLAALAAALGLHGDAPTPELAAAGRKLAQDRRRLLARAEIVIADSHPSDHGGSYLLTSSLDRLARAVADAKQTS
jgi:hypothetical protein